MGIIDHSCALQVIVLNSQGAPLGILEKSAYLMHDLVQGKAPGDGFLTGIRACEAKLSTGPEHGPHSHNVCPQGLYTVKTAEVVIYIYIYIINPHDTLWVPTGYHRGKKQKIVGVTLQHLSCLDPLILSLVDISKQMMTLANDIDIIDIV